MATAGTTRTKVRGVTVTSRCRSRCNASCSTDSDLPVAISRPTRLSFSDTRLPTDICRNSARALTLGLVGAKGNGVSGYGVSFRSSSVGSNNAIFINSVTTNRDGDTGLGLEVSTSGLNGTANAVGVCYRGRLNRDIRGATRVDASVRRGPRRAGTSRARGGRGGGPL